MKHVVDNLGITYPVSQASTPGFYRCDAAAEFLAICP